MHQLEPAGGATGPAPGIAGHRWRRITLAAIVGGGLLLPLTVAMASILSAPASELSPAPAAVPPGGDVPAGDAPAAPAQSWARTVVTADGLVDRVGVRIMQVALTGGGGLIDVRFQVLDPDKAAAIHDPANPPALVDEQTTVVANDLLMGHSHTGTFTPGLTYFLMFENPGNVVQAGGTVTVLLGDAQVERVEVR